MLPSARPSSTSSSRMPSTASLILRSMVRSSIRASSRRSQTLLTYGGAQGTSQNIGGAAMDLQLKGKIACVTGGSEGIGKGIAAALAREGCDVAICARRKDLLDKTAEEIRRASGRKVFTVAADLTREADARNFVESAHQQFGRIDIFVNNAGSAPGGVIETLSEEDWQKGLQLKFMGYVRCLKHVLPIMKKQGGGRVVNLIGNDGVKESYWEIVPGACNAAGQNLTVALAAQYGKHGIS